MKHLSVVQSCDVSLSGRRRNHFSCLNSHRGSLSKETRLNIEFKELSRH